MTAAQVFSFANFITAKGWLSRIDLVRKSWVGGLVFGAILPLLLAALYTGGQLQC
jgi:hypothetical protein